MPMVERVFALHDFDAENPDEVSFKAGEPVVVVERDDAYGDGWWQGTNTKGETGLFPFSYTTFDLEVAKGSATADRGSSAPAGANGKVMNSTMADIDEALAGLRTGNGVQAAKGLPADRRSMNSERTGDYSAGETDENGGNAEDDFEARARARAALAVNAAKDQKGVNAAEQAEQARMKAQAQRTFEEEEEKQRQLLLKREEERRVAVAQGKLQETDKPKVAPISGLDMSDESDSEGSDGDRDFDDANAPTHAPLFGGPATSPHGGAAGASEALRSVSSLTSSSKQMPGALNEPQVRSLSPIPSASNHSPAVGQTALFAGASAAAAAGVAAGSAAVHHQATSPHAVNVPPSEQANSFDQGSINSSRGRTSTVADSPAISGNNGTSATSVGGAETPKSQAPFNQGSPSPSVNASRGTGPGGDPHEWTVEQVVEWARSKGWDESQVVSKFVEHEISGDVLLEMDVNILKEIDIVAFGKRYQVATAIKELNKLFQGPGEVSATSWSALSDSAPSLSPAGVPPPSFLQQQRSMANISEPPSSQGHQYGSAAAAGTLGAAGAGLAAAGVMTHPSQVLPHSQFDIVQPSIEQRQASANGWTQSPMMPLEQDAASEGYGQQPFGVNDRRNLPPRTVSHTESTLSNVPPSPKKRESIGSASGKTSGDRTSFFGSFQTNKGRKAAPKALSPASAAPENDNNRGTFSRLGFSRAKGGAQEPVSPGQDIRNRISLPTSSPTYDAMGDTARRNRHQSNGSNNDPLSALRGTPAGAGMKNHQKRASVGSAGPNAADFYAPGNAAGNVDGSSAEGAVMTRIRPVDHEGWMRKKGERYNSWKPRYLALKGSDLVLLRDPTAAKIKGYVSMKGYKVIADENTNPGKYGFKILHESEKPHYFSSDDAIVVRDWMKALMKATIDRDTSLPVISSYNNATISLKEAQKMNPPPRPPSPTSVARAQRARARGNKDELTAKDASVLMGVQQANGTRGFLTADKLSPGTIQGYSNNVQPTGYYYQGKKRDSLCDITKPYNDTHERGQLALHGGRGNACVSPVEQVAPWILREESDTVLYAANPPPGVFDPRQVDQDEEDEGNPTTLYNAKMKSPSMPPKRVAPLRTHGLLPGKGSLPMLATPLHQVASSRREGGFDVYSPSSFSDPSSPPPPLPLPKSGQSDTMGCADLPPPPPPSHSPDHKYRIQSLLMRKRAPKQHQHHPWSDMPLPPVPHEGMTYSPMAPTPISKGINSASSYPTVSDSANPASSRIKSPNPPNSSSSRLSRKAGKRFLRDDDNRPRSAGAGAGAEREAAGMGSVRSLASMGPSSVGAAKNSFIVFSVNRGSTLDPRASFMTQESQSQARERSQSQSQSQDRQHVMTSPSDYSNNESVFMASPPLGADVSSPGFRGSSISRYLDMIPPAPKTAALPAYLPSRRQSVDKAHYRRSSSFDGLSRPRKESLRQETLNKPSWFKFTRDREKRKMTEWESEEKIVEAEREIHEQQEEEEEKEEYSEGSFQEGAEGYTVTQSTSSSQQEGFEEIDQHHWPQSSNVDGGSPRYIRPRCLSDQPYAGLLTLSPASMSPSLPRSPRSPPSQS